MYKKNPSLGILKTLRLQEESLETTKAILKNIKSKYFFAYHSMGPRNRYLKKKLWKKVSPKDGVLVSNYWYKGKDQQMTFETFLSFKDHPGLKKADLRVKQVEEIYKEMFISWFNKLPFEERKRLGTLYKKKGVFLTKKGKYMENPGGFTFNEKTWTMRSEQ